MLKELSIVCILVIYRMFYSLYIDYLQNMTEEPEIEKQHRINQIQTLYAVNLFCKLKFEESMKLFVNLDTGDYLVFFA